MFYAIEENNSNGSGVSLEESLVCTLYTSQCCVCAVIRGRQGRTRQGGSALFRVATAQVDYIENYIEKTFGNWLPLLKKPLGNVHYL